MFWRELGYRPWSFWCEVSHSLCQFLFRLRHGRFEEFYSPLKNFHIFQSEMVKQFTKYIGISYQSLAGISPPCYGFKRKCRSCQMFYMYLVSLSSAINVPISDEKLLLLPFVKLRDIIWKGKEMTSRQSTKRLCTKIDKNVQGTFGSHCKVVYMLQAYSGEFNDSETR